jgi:hypothetical protein
VEKLYPAAFIWKEITDAQTGEVIHAMVPRPHFRKQCDIQFVLDEGYVLDIHDDISTASRGHYFAALKDAWMNIHENDAARFPTAEHLRKYALCHTGWADERTVVCDSEPEAKRLAITIRAFDGYAVIARKDNIVQIWTARSQSARSMTKEEFQKSKTDVLDYITDLIGVKRSELEKQAGKTA